ncbi:MAG: thioredoxin [Planctomycetaceae bacterium]|nr:thioredoxin [Planctomycetaceae bacterium]
MSHVLHVNESNFETQVLQSPVPVLVDFFTTWCQPCKMLAPHLDQIASEFGDGARIVKINVEECPQLSVQYRIQAVPTLMLFNDGQLVDQIAPDPATIRYRLSGLCMA